MSCHMLTIETAWGSEPNGVVWCEGGGLLLTKGIVAIHDQTPPLDSMITTLYHDHARPATDKYNPEFNLFFTPTVPRLGNGHHPSIFQPWPCRNIDNSPPPLGSSSAHASFCFS